MAEKGFKRKLAAILSADVKGYSRLMGEDEEATVRTITVYREVMTTLIQQHNGKVLDSPGDNLLAEFASVVDAVQCAVAVQKEIKARNNELPENRRMQFRIGINLGDVIQEEDRIYGDGVNIAARLEGLSEPGGICISKTAFDHIESKLPYGYEFLGNQTVKNITKPVEAYRVLMEPRVTVAEKPEGEKPAPYRRKPMMIGAIAVLVVAIALVIWQFYTRRPSVEPASVEKMAYPLPDKPSIAVLPFKNLSDDPAQEYFCDGMTEDLITDLSKISGIFIISRNSTFAYKGKTVKIKQVAEELGVRYVLEGSVRKADKQIRINAQLIDAVTGHHLWADRYDGNLESVFSLQDKVTQKIIGSLTVKLTPNEKQHLAQKNTDNVEAYDTFLKGWEHCLRLTADDFAKAIPYLEKAIELDPKYGRAYAAMALIYWTTSLNYWKWEPTLGVTMDECYLSAPKYLAMAMENPTSLAHQVNADMMLYKRLHGKAIFEAERAIELDPNDARAQFTMGKVLIFDGRPEEGVEFIKKAMRLDPYYPAEPLCSLGLAHFGLGQLEKAVNLIERGLKHNPELYRFNLALTAAAAQLGLNKKAQETLVAWKRGHHFRDLRKMMFSYPFKDLKIAENFIEGLIKAGWPGETSEYYKISEESKLAGEQIKTLVFGRKVASLQGLIERTKDGIAYCRQCIPTIDRVFSAATFSDTGKSWIEDDMLCDQWQKWLQRQKICSPVFRNPEGKPERFDEYLSIPGLGESFGIIPWSPVD
jgi:TolB-like protein/class 3 adenylate cyclase/Flp pilus assembly protein TadD